MTGTLTAKQQKALDKAPKAIRKSMEDNFRWQSKQWHQPQKKSRPAPKQQSKPKAKPAPKPPRKVDVNIYSPYSTEPPPTTESLGYAALSTGTRQVEFQTSATGPVAYCLGLTPASNLVGFEVRAAADEVTAPSVTAVTTAQYADSASAGGPVSAKPARFGVELTAFSPTVFRGGSVTIWMPDQRMNTDPRLFTNNTEFRDWVSRIRIMPGAHTTEGSQFGKTKSWFCHPVDGTGYKQFKEWESTNVTETWSRTYTLTNGYYLAPMCPIIIVLDPLTGTFGDEPLLNSYILKVTAQWYMRFGAGDDRAYYMHSIPTAPLSIINKHRDHAEENHAGHGLMSGLGHLVGSAVNEVGSGIAKGISRHGSDIIASMLQSTASGMERTLPGLAARGAMAALAA